MEGVQASAREVWTTIKVWLRNISSLLIQRWEISSTDTNILRALEVPFSNILRRLSRLISWKKPTIGWVKLNVDGSCRGNPGNCGGGGLIRDSLGNFKAAFSSHFVHGTNNEGELRALIEGVGVCKEMGFTNITLECDSSLVVNWLKCQRCSMWYLWDYWDELLDNLQGLQFTIEHQFQEGNYPTDALACSAI
ncbi:hypothetical protein F2P56_035654 [Juglans regia]|uniref:RNase H type-1 domain-containing protein n=2 Tax=Juglans regia TaxID=51240 RepID=A0A833WSH2_JUGRE|nr:ribonuclease H-like [Juglans regia]KAF5443062.1 hypothetical protein F2P56_035654 [Juglans regia]